MAQWTTRLTTDQKIPGSTPGSLDIFEKSSFANKSTAKLESVFQTFYFIYHGKAMPFLKVSDLEISAITHYDIFMNSSFRYATCFIHNQNPSNALSEHRYFVVLGTDISIQTCYGIVLTMIPFLQRLPND